MINKQLRKEIQKRYGSFELSHDKNELIVEDIYNFVLSEKKDIAIEFGRWLISNPEISNSSSISKETAEYYFEQFLKVKQ